MNEPSAETLSKFEVRLRRLEEWIRDHSNVGTTVNEHDDRLDDHERQIGSLSTGFGEMRTELHLMKAQLQRATDAATFAGLAAERLEKLAVKDRDERLERDRTMQATLDRVVELLQPRVTLPRLDPIVVNK